MNEMFINNLKKICCKYYDKIVTVNWQYKAVVEGEKKYRLYIPKKNSDKMPLVMALHGADSRGNDNQRQIRRCVAVTNIWIKYRKEYPCFVYAPQCAEDKRWVETDWKKGSYSIDKLETKNEIDDFVLILKRIIHENNIDESRIYLVGNSMGGYASWYLLEKYPNLFTAALPICGAGDPSKAELISAIPVWACHGVLDEEIPISGTKDMINAIISYGGEPLYTEYSDKGHSVEGDFLRELDESGKPIRLEWLFSKKKIKSES